VGAARLSRRTEAQRHGAPAETGKPLIEFVTGPVPRIDMFGAQGCDEEPEGTAKQKQANDIADLSRPRLRHACRELKRRCAEQSCDQPAHVVGAVRGYSEFASAHTSQRVRGLRQKRPISNFAELILDLKVNKSCLAPA
jgi:hypothetical protein